MAEIVESIIDPGNGPGTDYTSLQAWVNARKGNLITRDTIEVAKCRCTNGQPDTATTIYSSDFTTDEDHYIKIYTDPAEGYRHQGVYPAAGSNIYRIEGGSGNTLLEITTAKVIIEGIAFNNTLSDSTYGGPRIWDAFIGGYIQNCVVACDMPSGDPHRHGIWVCSNSGTAKYYLKNNIVYGFKNWGLYTPSNYGIIIYPPSGQADVWIDNCTVYNCKMGIMQYDNNPTRVHVRNCIAQLCPGGAFQHTIGSSIEFEADSTNNISDDNTAAEFSNSWTNTTVQFLDVDNKDFHLSPAATTAKENGIDLTNDTDHPFNDDIDGQLRGGVWDIGADQVTISANPVEGSSNAASSLAAAIAGKAVTNANLNASCSLNGAVTIASLGVSDYLENKLLDHLFGGGDYLRPGILYVALCVSAPKDSDTGSTIVEAGFAGYQRKAITNNAINFPPAIDGVKANGIAISFNQNAGGEAFVTHFAICDASEGGNLLGFGALAEPFLVDLGSRPEIEPGGLLVSIE